MRHIAEMTADGSRTLYREDIDEHYGSIRGAVEESRHVYVDSCLRRAAASVGESGRPLRVLELGFGTGLNVAMSVGAIDRDVEFISLELLPLSVEEVADLGYDQFAGSWRRVIESPWDEMTQIAPHFALEKRRADFLTAELPGEIDAVYYDAFAPEKQPELWTTECFRRVYDAMRPEGVLTTYCAKGEVRRRLAGVGFAIERLAGPRDGKREILRAVKPNIV